MTEPENLTLEEATEILGVSREAGPAQIQRAYAEKLEALEKKVAQAATAALRNKYRTAVERLKLARESIEAQDPGLDLPALEPTRINPAAAALEPTRIQPPAPEVRATEPAATYSHPTQSTPPTAELKAAAGGPAKRFPLVPVLGGVGVLVVVGGFLMMSGGNKTAALAGDYRERVKYPSSMYDFSLNVDTEGHLTGHEQAADGTLKPMTVVGTVTGKGDVTAKAEDGTQYHGQIEGDEMKLEEKLTEKTFFFSLTKGAHLPDKAPAAVFAGFYHAPSIEYPNGNKFEFEFNLTEHGDLAGTCRSLKNNATTTITGHVYDYGDIEAQTTPDSDGTVTKYTGKVEGDDLILKEKLASGTVFNIKVTKGAKKRATAPAPTAAERIAGRYFSPSMEYPGGGVYEFEFLLAKSGSVDAYFRKIPDGKKYAVTGKVDADGKLTAATSDGGTTYSGTVEDGVLVLKEKLTDKDSSFTLRLKKTP